MARKKRTFSNHSTSNKLRIKSNKNMKCLIKTINYKNFQKIDKFLADDNQILHLYNFKDEGDSPTPYRKPKKFRNKEKPYQENDEEGKCRLLEAHTSSDEEQAAVRRSRKVIDEDIKENRKMPNKKNIPEADKSKKKKEKEIIDKRAKKVTNKSERKNKKDYD